ncbi:hypothetical protein [Pedobacter sp. Leaf194]|uniref:hypothetical protein n=1 Tax=Pedobacter sp. Leaf194 TaxID=1736297 RepID=UPI000702AF5F|nr:hypothetical protein [Pedobacter sp. Leaf194]KQS37022.1 hypothetical protein ASG14_08330 [Pedobacter sp. Leaf194]
MKNPFIKSTSLNPQEVLADKLKRYQQDKSKPGLSKKSFKDLMNTFIDGYKSIRKSKNTDSQ